MLNFLRKTALWILLAPAVVFGVGLFCNQAVLVANNDQFPVMWNSYKVKGYERAVEAVVEEDEDTAAEAQADLDALWSEGFIDDTHVVMSKKTHLNFLGDWIDLKEATYSPGDALLEAGEFGLTYAPAVWLTVAVQRLRKREDY